MCDELPVQRVILQLHEAVAWLRYVIEGRSQRQLALDDEGGAHGDIEEVADVRVELLQRLERRTACVAVVLVAVLDLIVPELVQVERPLEAQPQRPLIPQLDGMAVQQGELVHIVDPVRHVIVRIDETHGALLLMETLIEGEADGVVMVAQDHPLLPIAQSEPYVLRITHQ